MTYQSSKIGVSANAGQLLINDLASVDIVAEQTIAWQKAKSLKIPIIIAMRSNIMTRRDFVTEPVL